MCFKFNGLLTQKAEIAFLKLRTSVVGDILSLKKLITFDGKRSVAAKHVFSGGRWCHLSGVETFGFARFGVVDGHQEASADSGAVRMRKADAKQ